MSPNWRHYCPHTCSVQTFTLSHLTTAPGLLPWSLPPAGGDSSKSRSSGLFRFFDICCSRSEWWSWCVLITPDTFNRRDTQRKQQSGGGEERNANKSQSHSFRSPHSLTPLSPSSPLSVSFFFLSLTMSFFYNVLCAQSYHVVSSRASGDAARHGSCSHTAPGSLWTELCCSTPDTWEMSAAEVICPFRAWRFTAWTQCRWKLRTGRNLLNLGVSSLRPNGWMDEWMLSEGKLNNLEGLPFVFFLLLERSATTSDCKSNQARMTHRRHKGDAWISRRVGYTPMYTEIMWTWSAHVPACVCMRVCVCVCGERWCMCVCVYGGCPCGNVSPRVKLETTSRKES